LSISCFRNYIDLVGDVGIEKFNAAAAVLHGEIAFGYLLDEAIAAAR